jgi:hypothetical protein
MYTSNGLQNKPKKKERKLSLIFRHTAANEVICAGGCVAL